MSVYEDSIKCKYCSHFEPGVNRCHLGHSYDQSIDGPGHPYMQETSPDSRCHYFSLPAMDVLAGLEGTRRSDNSYVISLNDVPEFKKQLEEEFKARVNGCYVATCVYGSYDCPQVWTLRRFRDNSLASTWYGRLFIQIYYAVSPTLVKWFGQTSWFQNFWHKKLDKLVAALQAKGFESSPYQDKQW